MFYLVEFGRFRVLRRVFGGEIWGCLSKVGICRFERRGVCLGEGGEGRGSRGEFRRSR